MNELKTFLELWEIPITRRSLESWLEQLQRIFRDEIAAYRKERGTGKVDVQIFINTETPTGPEAIQ
jgi:hypothetical protein